jgi:AbrB family looped-hinge helix DNA binding protein
MTVPVKFELSIMQVGSSLRVTIPKEISKYLNLKKGDTVSMWIDNSHIIVEKKKAKE